VTDSPAHIKSLLLSKYYVVSLFCRRKCNCIYTHTGVLISP